MDIRRKGKNANHTKGCECIIIEMDQIGLHSVLVQIYLVYLVFIIYYILYIIYIITYDRFPISLTSMSSPPREGRRVFPPSVLDPPVIVDEPPDLR